MRRALVVALGIVVASAAAAGDGSSGPERSARWQRASAAGVVDAESARAVLEAAPFERARLAALRAQADADCHARILVNDCLDRARRAEREALQPVESFERAARARLREDEAQRANRDRAVDEARRVREDAAGDERREASLQRQAQRLQRREREQARRAEDDRRRAERAAQASARFERRERALAERQAQAAERAQRAAKNAAEHERRVQALLQRNAERDRDALARRDDALRQAARRQAQSEQRERRQALRGQRPVPASTGPAEKAN